MRRSGFGLVELLVTMALTAIVGVALGTYIRGFAQTTRLQRELTEMDQNGAVVATLLRRDLSLAGYRGGNDVTTADGAAAVAWLADHWNRLRIGTAGVPTLSAESALDGDVLVVRWVEGVTVSSGTAVFRLKEVSWTLDPAGRTLSRRESDLTSQGVTLSSPPMQVTLTANTGAWAVVAEGIDDFEVFFRDGGKWKDRPSASTSLAGVYLTQAPPGAKSRPSACKTLPASGKLPDHAVAVGVRSRAHCRERTLDRVLYVNLPNTQS